MRESRGELTDCCCSELEQRFSRNFYEGAHATRLPSLCQFMYLQSLHLKLQMCHLLTHCRLIDRLFVMYHSNYCITTLIFHFHYVTQCLWIIDHCIETGIKWSLLIRGTTICESSSSSSTCCTFHYWKSLPKLRPLPLNAKKKKEKK